MPRKARPQRTDLNATKVTVPGQDYGKQTAQAQAMTAVPMANQAQQIAQLQQGAAKAPTSQAAPMGMPQGVPAAAPAPAPIATLDTPTQMPDQHLTHGLATGPGPGPEVNGVSAQSQISAILEQLATGPFGTPDLAKLADYAKNQGF